MTDKNEEIGNRMLMINILKNELHTGKITYIEFENELNKLV